MCNASIWVSLFNLLTFWLFEMHVWDISADHLCMAVAVSCLEAGELLFSNESNMQSTPGFKNTSNKESIYQAGNVGSVRSREVCHKITCIHALAIRAAAAVPEQSPPAAQLWGATPESPYWSPGWAETHFLWAQVTWYKAETVEAGSGENKGGRGERVAGEVRGQGWGGGDVVERSEGTGVRE